MRARAHLEYLQPYAGKRQSSSCNALTALWLFSWIPGSMEVDFLGPGFSTGAPQTHFFCRGLGSNQDGNDIVATLSNGTPLPSQRLPFRVWTMMAVNRGPSTERAGSCGQLPEHSSRPNAKKQTLLGDRCHYWAGYLQVFNGEAFSKLLLRGFHINDSLEGK